MEPELTNSEERCAVKVMLRLETPEDREFLFDLFASARAEELRATQWDAHAMNAFLRMQFSCQTQSYRNTFPLALFLILTLDDREIGRIILDQLGQAIRVVDLAIVPDWRGKTIGTNFMKCLLDEATHLGRAVRLSTLKGSRAASWYERLGFRNHGGTGLHDEMEWNPTELKGAGAVRSSGSDKEELADLLRNLQARFTSRLSPGLR